MSNTNTGGPAFPTNDTHTPEKGWSRAKDGMTLRDYFAAKAMQGMMADGQVLKLVGDSELAKAAYAIADEMLKARGA